MIKATILLLALTRRNDKGLREVLVPDDRRLHDASLVDLDRGSA